jgi:hypothetical protein
VRVTLTAVTLAHTPATARVPRPAGAVATSRSLIARTQEPNSARPSRPGPRTLMRPARDPEGRTCQVIASASACSSSRPASAPAARTCR